MKLEHQHPWAVGTAEARSIQERLRRFVVTEDLLGRVRFVAGVDVGHDMQGNRTRAAIAVLRFPSLELADVAIAETPTEFPYVPGLLSFRELPAVLQALAGLDHSPDLLLCDGQGLAHPRRFGIACHLGVLTGIPSIGVAKTRLIGTHDEVPDARGEWVSLRVQGETIGAVLRSRKGVKPVYVSIGHKVSLEKACDLVMACTSRYRLPETTRQADRLASGKGAGIIARTSPRSP